MFKSTACNAMRQRLRACSRPAALSLLVAVAGCTPPPPPAVALTPAQRESLHPADAALAARYDRSCALCHARAGSGAPLVADAAAWAPRLARGDAALLASVTQGRGGMPPRGLCPDCSDDDLRALIHFLATGASR